VKSFVLFTVLYSEALSPSSSPYSRKSRTLMQNILRHQVHIYHKGWRRQFSVMRKPDLEVDNLVIGGGVVGLAVAERLARQRSPESSILVERHGRIGEETRFVIGIRMY
jgi:heterodisulfide reductase subunit A-like polyferredoxin